MEEQGEKMKLKDIKVGMRVVWYTHTRVTGVVNDINKKGLVDVIDGDITHIVHHKALRKLVKKEPEIRWVRYCNGPEEGHDLVDWPGGTSAPIKKCHYCSVFKVKRVKS